MKIFAALLCSACMLATGARAQGQVISRFTIAGGGGTSTGGVFAVSGTLGQPDAGGVMMSDPYSVTGAFWPGVNLVQTPNAPRLAAELLGGGNARIGWLRPATGFVLDQSLTVTGAWAQVAFPYATNATHISVTVPATGEKYFRLRKP